MKNMANFMELYSLWNPATSSVSASGRSNGARFVSASAQMKKMTKPSGWLKTNQLAIGTTPSHQENPCLRLHDLRHAERPRQRIHAHHRQAHGQLVADHLGRGAQPAQERVLVVGRPAGQDDPVHPERGDPEDVEQPHVDVGDLQGLGTRQEPEQGGGAAEGNHRRGDHGRHHAQRRRKQEEGPVHLARDQVLLEEQLDPVGDGLQQPEGAHAGGPQAHLDASDHLSLDPGHVGRHQEEDAEHHPDLDHHDDERLKHRGYQPPASGHQ